MKINWNKASTYTILASGVATGSILPTIGYFNLIKKSEKLNEMLKQSKENLDETKENTETFRTKSNQYKKTTEEAECGGILKQAEKLRKVSSSLKTRAGQTISKIKNAFRKIKERNDIAKKSWFFIAPDNRDIVNDLRNAFIEHEKVLKEQESVS